MVVSLQSYKIQKTVQRLSVEVQQDLEKALLQQKKVYLPIAHQKRHRVEPGFRFLEEAGAAYFWEVTDKLALGQGKAILYVGTAADVFEAHVNRRFWMPNK